jgi:basic membrane protein A
MSVKRFLFLVGVLAALSIVVSACATATEAPTEAPDSEEPSAGEESAGEEEAAEPAEPAAEAESGAGYEIPTIEEGKFNVAGVLFSPHDDGGWGQAAYEGLVYMEEQIPDLHMAYVESVPEGTESEQVFRALSRKGFDMIIGVSFGYMDPMLVVSEEFPDVTYIHIAGYKSNEVNFGNLFGAEEDMYYLAAMLAGARAQMDGNPKLGVLLSFPIPEELRFANAIALGMKETCPECTLDVRWINTWHDPVVEKEAAASLFDAGAHVVFNTADTPAAAQIAEQRGEGYGVIAYYGGTCQSYERCLTAAYFNYGPVFTEVARGVMDGTYEPGWDYFTAESNGLGLYGFMEGQTVQPGVAELPEEVVQTVQEKVEQMLAGELNRYNIWCGPITDNTGELVVPEGECLEYADFDQFPPGSPGLECEYCMHWYADGITAELPEISE